MIKWLVIGFVLGILVWVGAGYYYFASGMAPVAVSDPLMPFERKMANMALHARIEKQHIGQPPIPADEANLLAGAEVYKQNCAVCHGLPGHPVDYVNMMFPKPTQLFKGKGVTDDPPSGSYWKAVNGIRLSGMPSFKNQLSDTQLWQVSMLVAHANEVPESVKNVLLTATQNQPATK
ncbi:MAG TPA: cytochrome c [Candidatus Acidoferrales bacterium]|nr:cytochrome c [Candidatus Acidoferrales bacterium]